MPDENSFVKATTVVRQALGLLERSVVLPNLVWRDPGGDFAGAEGDTITLRVPAFVNARTRQLRGGRPIQVDNMAETKVNVTLDTVVYKAVGIDDEQMTLDIVNFGEQVTQPIVASVGRGVEDAVSDEIANASYDLPDVAVDPDDVFDSLVDAREALNMASVPFEGRALAVGSRLEGVILKDEHFNRADQSGSTSALRDAQPGRIAGFDITVVPALPPDMGVAFHRTAFALSMKVPAKPEGATWGATESYAGLAMRVLRDYDFDNVRDRLLADTFIGTNSVTDKGALDEDGRFIPAEDPDDSGVDDLLVRAVKLTLGS